MSHELCWRDRLESLFGQTLCRTAVLARAKAHEATCIIASLGKARRFKGPVVTENQLSGTTRISTPSEEADCKKEILGHQLHLRA